MEWVLNKLNSLSSAITFDSVTYFWLLLWEALQRGHVSFMYCTEHVSTLIDINENSRQFSPVTTYSMKSTSRESIRISIINIRYALQKRFRAKLYFEITVVIILMIW